MSWTASPSILSAASNICAWTLQARSQVGWRLMVASSAKTRRPRASAVALGPIFLAEETKASIAAAGEEAAGAPGGSVLERSFLSVMRDHARASFRAFRGRLQQPAPAKARRSVQRQAGRRATRLLPGADGAAVDADVAQLIAEGNEIALADLELERDLVVGRVLDLGRREAIEGGRHLGVGEGDRHGAEHGRELIVELAGVEVAHLDEVAVGVLAHLVAPVQAFR